MMGAFSRSRRAAQAGVSVLEVAVALAMMGTLTVAAVRLQQGAVTTQTSRSEGDLIKRADGAVAAYLVRNARLPCPAPNNGGIEDCDGSADGFVPWRTIGLPDASAAALTYRVGGQGRHMRPPGAIDVFELDGWSFSTKQFDGGDLIVQRCAALDQSNTPNNAIAYELHSPMNAEFDSASAGIPRDSGGGVVRTTASLWQTLHCGGLIGSAARAHKNAAVAAQMMRLAAGENLQFKELDNGAAIAAIVFGLSNFATQLLRMPAKMANAGLTCLNLASLNADFAAATQDAFQISSYAEASIACAVGTADIVVHAGYLENRAAGVTSAIWGLTGSNATSLNSQRTEDEVMEKLSRRIRDRANTSLAQGLSLLPVSNP